MARNILSRILPMGLLGLTLAACAPMVDTRGNLAEADRLRQITPGVSRQDDVAALLGTPSSVGTFDANTWYYIGQRTEKTAFFRPEVVDRKVVVVKFDDSGTVQSVEMLDKDAGQEIDVVDRRTPTAGKDLGIFEQILGNVGRFGGQGTTTRTIGRPMPGS